MKASIQLIAAASVVFFSAGTLLAQAPTPATAEPPKPVQGGGAPSTKKPKAAGQTAAKSDTADKPLKPGHYATEAEAKSHCNGAVVWVGSEGFTHYRGSREYGRKPGSFTCDK